MLTQFSNSKFHKFWRVWRVKTQTQNTTFFTDGKVNEVEEMRKRNIEEEIRKQSEV